MDLETFSSVDIETAGLYPYVESPDFEILLVAYAWGDDPVRCLDLVLEGDDPEVQAELQDVLAGLQDPDTLKIAQNNAFERTALGKYARHYQPPEEWHDTAVLAAMNGLPMNLEGAGAALNIEQQKLKEGKALINYFCKPCKPTKTNGGRTRNMPGHAPDKWERFKAYCVRDVVAERTIYRRLEKTQITEEERRVWLLDTRINERGVLVDAELAEAAVAVDEAFKAEHSAELQRLTGLGNPNSPAQIKAWLATVGLECESLNKAAVADLKSEATDRTTKRVLELRQMLGKTSTTKYQAMLRAACNDGRIRGITQYYGAGRTGRWAGRLVQLQNLPQNHLDVIDKVREVVRARDLETLELCYDSVPDVLSQLIRTALVAKPGHTFLVSDYAAIEARVIAYLAGEQWRMDVFKEGGDIYCRSASQIFGVPVVKHGINGHLRQRGKVAELACGYGGGVNAMRAMDNDHALDNLTDAEVKAIVTQWRAASPTIPRLWSRVEDAAKAALENPGRRVAVLRKQRDPARAAQNEALTGGRGYSQEFLAGGSICTYWRDKDALRCKLPSGRILTYWNARLEGGKIVFEGLTMVKGRQTKKWGKIDTWGGKLVENIVQAFARDCLAVAMLRLDEAGYAITFHVHDEIIAEAPEGSRWEDMAEIMGRPIDWAPGLLLRGDGYETKFYMKD